MKLLKRQISAKDASGLVVLRPETSEDLWHAYNLLQKGDLVRTTTLRKVIKESSTGSTSSQKKRMQLTVQVEKVEFDPVSLEVRLSGPTTTSEQSSSSSSANQYVRMGAYHTLTLEPSQNFSLEKECWDRIFLDRIEEATSDPSQQAEIAAVVMQSTGLAHVCLLTGSLTLTQARIDMPIPKKRNAATQQRHNKAVTKFYRAIHQGILRLNFAQIKVCLLASPGFVKDDFFQYMMQQEASSSSSSTSDQQQQHQYGSLLPHKHKFVLCRCSSGHKHAIDEVLSDSKIMAQIQDTKVVREVTVLNRFMRMISTDPHRAYYGYASVRRAQDLSAIDSLLVTDQLFRANNVTVRKQYVQLVEDCRESGGHVHVFSTMHTSGQQLQQVSGVAAILRYPLPEIEDEQDNDDDDDDFDEEEESDEEEYDPDRRIREDVEDMGF